MEQLTSDQVMDDSDTCVYLRHHAVIKKDSLTTKCRVVFDGPGKDSSGISLTESLHINALLVSDQSFNTTRRSLGEALALVKHIPMTNENYSEAWDKLENRYNKKPLINR